MQNNKNADAYFSVSHILNNADRGFFVVTAPPRMQRTVVERYENKKTAVYDYAAASQPFSYPALNAWAEENKDEDVFFILNMQIAFMGESGGFDEAHMLSFNMARDVLAKKRKIWIFCMTAEAYKHLAAYADLPAVFVVVERG